MTVCEFAEKTVNIMGGVFEMKEYALSSVLIPDEYAGFFNGKTELLLAFDYDVAQENPQSEFVAYGSFIFDAFLEISRFTPSVTHRYVNADRTDIPDAGAKIKKALELEAVPEISDEELGTALFVRFVFSIKYISDEITENIIPVWINLLTGEYDKDMNTNQTFIYSGRNLNNILHFECSDIGSAYQKAAEYTFNKAKQNPTIETDQRIIESETGRIDRYYDELIAENKKRAERKGQTDERLKEIAEKETSLIIEKERQISEIINKFTTKIEISLENAAVYHIPCKRFTCLARNRAKSEFTVYYNFALKKFFRG
jgi:hypothetical protein